MGGESLRTTLVSALIVFTLAVFSPSWSSAAKGAIPPVPSPQKVRVRGDLLERMMLAVKCLDQATSDELWGGFTTGYWGADWPGRTLEAYARISLSAGEECTKRFDEVGEGLLARQSEDGAFHTGKADSPGGEGGGLWFGNARGMLGLLWAYRYRGEDKYLNAARKLGDYYVDHYFDEDRNKRGSLGWVATEALVELYKETGDARYVDAAVRIAQSIPALNLRSQHTHSYLLSIRGVARTYEETRDPQLLNKVLDQERVFRERIMWPRGGIVEHLGSRDAYNIDYWYDECCSVCDWLGLNLDLWRITKSASYMDMVERVALNHLLYDQDAGGGFCGDRGIDFVRQGLAWRYCCAMHGARTLSEITQYVVASDGRDIYVNLFYPSTVELDVDDRVVKLELETSYPEDGNLSVNVDPGQALDLTLKIRVPTWSAAQKVALNGKEMNFPVTGGYLSIQRTWERGDKVEAELSMPLRTEQRQEWIADGPFTDYTRVSLWKGPRQLVYNQEFNNHLWKRENPRPALRYAYQAYGRPEFDKSVKGTPLRIGSRNYAKGLGVHAVSEMVYCLGGEFKEFIADIGIDECAGDEGKVRFKVCVDGVKQMCEVIQGSFVMEDGTRNDSQYGVYADALTGRDAPLTIGVSVEEAQVLRLVVDEFITTSLRHDEADWADARLVKADGTVVYLSDLPDDRQRGLPWDWGTVLLREIKDESQDDDIVTLLYECGEDTVPIRFNPLADLGFSLFTHRPVLHSWMKVDSSKETVK